MLSQFYLRTLRDETISDELRLLVLHDSKVSAGPLEGDSTAECNANAKLITPKSETPPAYPLIQPMKAAFYFDSVDGFGQWQVLISTRASRDLREYRKKDQKLFIIVLKKIK